MTPAARALLAPLLCALALLGLAVPASAASAASPRGGGGGTEPTGALRVVSQTPWVGTAGESWRLVLDVRAPGPPDRLELAVVVHRRVSSRSDFARTLEQPPDSSLPRLRPALVSDLAPDAGGHRVVELAVGGRSGATGQGRWEVALSREGVHPVTVTLRSRDDGAVLSRLTTHLAYLPEPVTEKLKVALVLPAHAPPALRPDGTRELAEADVRALGDLAGVLDGHPTVPVTLRPTPETMAALAASPRRADRDALAGLAGSGPGRQVVGGPYVAAPLAALRRSGLDADAERQLALGADTLARTLGARPGLSTAVVDRTAGNGTVARLAKAGARRAVVAEELLSPGEEARPLTLAQPFVLADSEGSGERLEAAVADAGLDAHFAGAADGADPVLAASHFLADLAVLYLDRPGAKRAVVAVAPATPGPEFLDAVLDGLAASPVAAGATLDDLFASVPPARSSGRELVRELAPSRPEDDALPGPALRQARDRLGAFRSILLGPSPLAEALEEARLVAESSDLDEPTRTARLAGIDVRIDEELSRIQLRVDPAVTLTARRGDVPVAVTSELDYPVRVALRLRSEKLAFPEGDVRVFTLDGRANLRFVVDARTSGRFPLDVTLSSPDPASPAALGIGRSRAYVRSTAASGVGVALTVGALAVLAGWWGRHLLSERRRKRQASEEAPSDGVPAVRGRRDQVVAPASADPAARR